MDGRVRRGRGGSWKRGSRGGSDTDGEHRGRGRGGHHRGRGKRDHYRGRGRGGGSHADFPQRYQDEGEMVEDEDDRAEMFSRRKLESNWDRYEEAERVEEDDEPPTQRGTDYHVLLESSGDSFTQFRFSDEKDWETDSFSTCQTSAVLLDLPALAQSLHQLPLHQRLNLEADLVQVSTPAELPAVGLTPKPEVPKTNTFTPLSTAFKGLGTKQKPPSAAVEGSDTRVSSAEDDCDEELDQLLGLQKPVGAAEEAAPPEEEPEEVASLQENSEQVKEEAVAPSESTTAMTEEDLEDWLDSMIS